MDQSEHSTSQGTTPDSIQKILDTLIALPAQEQWQRIQSLRETDPNLANKVSDKLCLHREKESVSDESLPRQRAEPDAVSRTIDQPTASRHLGLNDNQTTRDSQLPASPFDGHGSIKGPDPLDGPAIRLPGYTLVEKLGEGGMGVVWRARELSTNRDVAIKLLHGSLIGSSSARERFRREVTAVASMNHANIVKVYTTGMSHSVFYFVMELIPGKTLSQFLQDSHVTVFESLGIFEKICRAVGHAHEAGMVHRDLKPGNIIVTSDGEPHLLDFGLAKCSTNETVTNQGQVLGTLAYMSPEQLDGVVDQVGPTSDVFSLGVILYEMVTGMLPFKRNTKRNTAEPIVYGPPPIHLSNSSIRRGLELICHKALARDAEYRYHDANEFADDIHRLLNFEDVLARPPSRMRRLYLWCSRAERAAQVSQGLSLALLLLASIHAFAILLTLFRSKVMGSDHLDGIDEPFFYGFLTFIVIGSLVMLIPIRQIARNHLLSLYFSLAVAVLSLPWCIGNALDLIPFTAGGAMKPGVKPTLYIVFFTINMLSLGALLIATVSIYANRSLQTQLSSVSGASKSKHASEAN